MLQAVLQFAPWSENLINAIMQMIIAISKRMLQPKLTIEWIVYLKTLKPVLWSWLGSRLWRAGRGSTDCGMFCDARVLKVTDWVMWGIFAYWPSWSVSVNKELKPLYISSQTIPLTLSFEVSVDIDGAQEDIVFLILNIQVQFPLPMYHIPTPFKVFVFAPNRDPSDPSANAHYRC